MPDAILPKNNFYQVCVFMIFPLSRSVCIMHIRIVYRKLFFRFEFGCLSYIWSEFASSGGSPFIRRNDQIRPIATLKNLLIFMAESSNPRN